MSTARKPAAPDLGALMRRVQRTFNIGRVSVSLGEVGPVFHATAYRTTEQAARHSAEVFRQAGVESVSLARVSEETARSGREPIAYGSGKSPAEAVAALGEALAKAETVLAVYSRAEPA